MFGYSNYIHKPIPNSIINSSSLNSNWFLKLKNLVNPEIMNSINDNSTVTEQLLRLVKFIKTFLNGP